MVFKIFGRVDNNRDGSVSIKLYNDPVKAIREEEIQNEEEGWSESSFKEIILKIEDGKIFYYTWVYDKTTWKMVDCWLPAQEVQ